MEKPNVSELMQAIDVEVPVAAAYDQWARFEEFPHFMEGVDSVARIGDDRLRWKASVGGATKEWTARITEQIPSKRIAWSSVDGATNAGVVTFHRLSETTSRVALQLDYEPEGIVEKIGDGLGVVSRRIQGDLARFKTFVEERGNAAGAMHATIVPPTKH